MKRFEKVQLGSVADIKGGKRLPNGADFSAAPTTHPYIRARDIGQGKIQIDDPVYLSDDIAHRIARYTVKVGDVCLTIVGANVGDIGAVPQELDGANLTENAVKIVSNGKVDQAYLKYALLSDDAMAQMKVQAGGAAQPKLGIYKVEIIEIPLVPLPFQRRIADILSAYDELIENNQRRIKILEEMARSLYREWFVHFRFPGHVKAKMVISPLGPIPQGWEVKKLAEIAENMRRNVSKGELDGARPYVGLEHIPRRSFALDVWEMATDLGSNKLEFKKGEVLFGKIRPYFHKVSVTPFDGVCSADTIVIRARRPEEYAFVVACVSSDAFVAQASATANGAKMPRANWEALQGYKVVIPAGQVAEKFSTVFTDMITQQQALIFQIQKLRLTRNLLLPRLLSGQINVNPVVSVA